ncbi:hypothetical protein EYF80_048401 [Liparis tanakae]|uniref:Uncharacterized protein n=1 Tax=Liparis tanakae TaxID=230148 RepID=A0A4Z2FJW6_9TELE|nr:hypothetical protein EYF80_048401 [Liparis tanakae]
MRCVNSSLRDWTAELSSFRLITSLEEEQTHQEEELIEAGSESVALASHSCSVNSSVNSSLLTGVALRPLSSISSSDRSLMVSVKPSSSSSSSSSPSFSTTPSSCFWQTAEGGGPAVTDSSVRLPGTSSSEFTSLTLRLSSD